MNTLTRTARRNATSVLHTRFPTTCTSFIARKSTLTQVFSDKASQPTGFHSQAIKANGFVFLSAQIPADRDGKLISGGVKAQAEKMVENTRVVLEEAGSGLEGVVKVNVSTKTMSELSVKDFHMVEEIDEVLGKRFPQKPARSLQQVVFVERGADMMMDCVAVVDRE